MPGGRKGEITLISIRHDRSHRHNEIHITSLHMLKLKRGEGRPTNLIQYTQTNAITVEWIAVYLSLSLDRSSAFHFWMCWIPRGAVSTSRGRAPGGGGVEVMLVMVMVVVVGVRKVINVMQMISGGCGDSGSDDDCCVGCCCGSCEVGRCE